MNDIRQEPTLGNNDLAFIGLCNEYCHALEQAATAPTGREELVAAMLRLLPRIYISATDLTPAGAGLYGDEVYVDPSLEEDAYDAVRRAVEAVMGEEDVYLEVFEEDMKYSDTPISASVAENLADLYQVFYNFTEMVKRVPTDMIPGVLEAVKEDFGSYWSRPLCNVMRALNQVRYS